jgi:hypothetical protein
MFRIYLGMFLILAGCGTLRPPTSTIWEPQTEFGRSFRTKYIVNFQNMLVDLRSIPELGDIVAAIWFGSGADSSSRYFGPTLGTYKKFNTLRTNFEDRAASAVSELILPVLQAVAKQNAPLNDPSISGAYVSIAWTASDFSLPYGAGELEAVRLYIPRAVLDDFLAFKFTNQDLLNRSIVFGYKSGRSIGRIQFNVNKNL